LFDFRRVTVGIRLGYRLSNNKITRYAKHLGKHGPLGPPGYAYVCHGFHVHIRSKSKHTKTQRDTEARNLRRCDSRIQHNLKPKTRAVADPDLAFGGQS